MKKKHLLSVVLMSVLGTGVLAGCGNSEASADDAIVLRYAYASNSQPVIDSMKEFGRLIEEKTDGEVVVE